jgi:RNA polymerase sigma-70 factor (ECF subfamily)
MTMPEGGIPAAETLLEHEPFVRRVAQAVLRGDARVDDVVQDTWLAALRGGPDDARSLRSWLSRVARRGALLLLRREGRRRKRESRAARPEGLPSAAEIAAREEVRGRLLRAVLAMEEPYRGALVLRFYEGLPPREMARRLDVPVETAKTRVKRGLALLRKRLDSERDGDRRSLLAGLLLLLDRPGTTPPAVYAAAGILAVAVLVTSVALLSIGSDADPEPVPRAEAGQVRAPGETEPPRNVGDGSGLRADVSAVRSSFLEVRVRDAISGLAIAGAEVRAGPEAYAAKEGTARLPLPAGPLDLLVHADGYFAKRVRVRTPDSPLEVGLVPETRFGYVNRIVGRVETVDGAPAPDSFVLLERSDGLVDTTRADTKGRFVLFFPMSHWGATVHASHPRLGQGFERIISDWLGLQQRVRYEVVVRLGAPPQIPLRILEEGRPAERAYRLVADRIDGWGEKTGERRDLGDVRDGDLLSIDHGSWRLDLLDAPNGSTIAPSHGILVSGSGIHGRNARAGRTGDRRARPRRPAVLPAGSGDRSTRRLARRLHNRIEGGRAQGLGRPHEGGGHGAGRRGGDPRMVPGPRRAPGPRRGDRRALPRGGRVAGG